MGVGSLVQLKGWLRRADNNSVMNTPIIYAPSHALAHFAFEFAAEQEKHLITKSREARLEVSFELLILRGRPLHLSYTCASSCGDCSFRGCVQGSLYVNVWLRIDGAFLTEWSACPVPLCSPFHSSAACFLPSSRQCVYTFREESSGEIMEGKSS